MSQHITDITARPAAFTAVRLGDTITVTDGASIYTLWLEEHRAVPARGPVDPNAYKDVTCLVQNTLTLTRTTLGKLAETIGSVNCAGMLFAAFAAVHMNNLPAEQ